MTEADLNLMIARTGSDHLRWLVSDQNPDAVQRGDARRWVHDHAVNPNWVPEPVEAVDLPENPEPPPASIDWPAWKRATHLGTRNCLYWSTSSACGCTGGRCWAKDRIVTAADCKACLK